MKGSRMKEVRGPEVDSTCDKTNVVSSSSHKKEADRNQAKSEDGDCDRRVLLCSAGRQIHAPNAPYHGDLDGKNARVNWQRENNA